MVTFDPKQYWENRLSNNEELLGVGYLKLGKHYNNWLYRLRRKVFLRHISSLAVDWKRANVLEIGSGTGYYVNLWNSLGVNSVTATDITKFSVKSLKKKFPKNDCYRLDIGGNLPKSLTGKQFDAISAFDILYHIIDDMHYKKAFENVFRMLRPGGLFIFSENFIHGKSVRMQHQVSRSLDEILEILNQTGFKVKARVPMSFLMNYPIDSKSTLPKLLWQAMLLPTRKLNFFGFLTGAVLYPFDLALTSYTKEGPSTELMICEKCR